MRKERSIEYSVHSRNNTPFDYVSWGEDMKRGLMIEPSENRFEPGTPDAVGIGVTAVCD